jgi:hypothetical protein
MGEGIVHTPQGVEGQFHQRLDQPEAVGQADARPKGAQRPIRLEQVITSVWGRQQHRLQQSRQGRIHPGVAHQNHATAMLFKHLQSAGAYDRGSSLQAVLWKEIHPSASDAAPPALNWKFFKREAKLAILVYNYSMQFRVIESM